MLSYQHAYHAGNPADLHKHMALAGLLALLTRKSRPVTYVETHAGRGLYDLASPEALKTSEAALGIGSVAGGDHPYFAVIDAVRDRHGPSAYPGSPLIAQTLLRDIDRLHLFELHPAEHAALAALAAANTTIHHAEGRQGSLDLAPPSPRRGLVLVDPSYEVKTEYDQTAAFARDLLGRWKQASILIWYPVLQPGRHLHLLQGLAALRPLTDQVSFPQKDGRGMSGSGLILLNPPQGAGEVLAATHRLTKGILTPVPPG